MTLSIVILNYNGRHYLEQFLPTVLLYSKGHEVIVADNASTDDSVAYMKSEFPNVRLIENAENGGFAKGYNDALKQVDTDLYLLLNSDIEVTEDWLLPLLAEMRNPEVAGVQPKVLSHNIRDQFEHAGAAGGYLDRNYYPFCRGRIFEHTEKDRGQYNTRAEIFWASGACLLIRREDYWNAGGLDEDFFAHMEEIDLCWRIKRSGKKFICNPKSTVYHVGGGTLSYFSPFKTYLNFRNSLFMIIKNHEGPILPMIFWRLCLDGLAGVRFVAGGEWKQLNSLWKAHRDMYKNLSKMLKKRKALKAKYSSMNRVGLESKNLLIQRFAFGRKKYSDLGLAEPSAD